jgi:hypothetical protein
MELLVMPQFLAQLQLSVVELVLLMVLAVLVELVVVVVSLPHHQQQMVAVGLQIKVLLVEPASLALHEKVVAVVELDKLVKLVAQTTALAEMA